MFICRVSVHVQRYARVPCGIDRLVDLNDDDEVTKWRMIGLLFQFFAMYNQCLGTLGDICSLPHPTSDQPSGRVLVEGDM